AFEAPGGELLLQTACALQVVLGAVIPLFATAAAPPSPRGGCRGRR
ncbi:CDP-diacylglycerol--serine O-phosphatidyltransferase, partial [Streptomyces sparsogenes]